MLKDKMIAVDFDQTLAYGTYPECGKPNVRLIDWLNECKKNGCKLILFTCREGKPLEDAVEWCKEHGLEFDAVNDNLEEVKQRLGANPRKVLFDHYIDTTNVIPDYALDKWQKEQAEDNRRKVCVF